MALVEAAKKQGIAGATVTKGIAGYGKHRETKKAGLFDLSSHLPMVVTVTDEAAAIEAFLPLVKEIVQEGTVIQETINVVHGAIATDS